MSNRLRLFCLGIAALFLSGCGLQERPSAYELAFNKKEYESCVERYIGMHPGSDRSEEYRIANIEEIISLWEEGRQHADPTFPIVPRVKTGRIFTRDNWDSGMRYSSEAENACSIAIRTEII